MLLDLRPSDPQPLFEQIAFGVKRAVAEGRLRPGDRLPSVRELARQLTINPNTVARAYGALEADGVILRRQGSGCFVAEPDSLLSDRERSRRLATLVERLTIEAFHLGFDPDEVRAALEERWLATSVPRRQAR